MTIRVSELEGVELDYWVAKACGDNPHVRDGVCHYGRGSASPVFSPTRYWSDCGPLIERFGVTVCPARQDWMAAIERETPDHGDLHCAGGPTPQIAICRAVVAGRFGAEFEPTGEAG